VKSILEFIVYKRSGMYLRFGDGDFNLAENKDDMLARANPLLQKCMLNSMTIRDENVMICVPHHCKEIATVEVGMYPGNHEYPVDYVERFLRILQTNTQVFPEKIYTNVALSYCSVHYPDMVIQLHKELKTNKILYLGNYIYSDIFLNKLFGDTITRINTNHNNAFHDHDRIIAEVDLYMKENSSTFFVVIIAAGCASRALASILYEKYLLKGISFFFFDYGSLLDYLYGFNTRAYMGLMPPKKEYILNSI
jgi:hypothetical protein